MPGETALMESRRADPELAGLIEVVDARYQGRTGGAYPADEDAASDWLVELDAAVVELQQHLRHAVNVINAQKEGIRYGWADYENTNHLSPVAWISEHVGGAIPLTGHEFDQIDAELQSIEADIATARFTSAANNLWTTAHYSDQVAQAWGQFLEAAGGGAGTSTTVLEVTRDASFTIVTAYLTGGATSALGVTSAVGRVAVAAAVAGGGEIVKTSATEVGQIIAGTRQEFDVTDALIDGLKGAAVTAAGGAITEAVGPFIAENLAGPLADRLQEYVGLQAASYAEYIVHRLLTQIPGTLIQTIVATTIDAVRGQHFGTSEELWRALTQRFASNYWQALLGEALLSLGTSGNLHDMNADIVGDHIAGFLGRGTGG